jgi:hypothetical protein
MSNDVGSRVSRRSLLTAAGVAAGGSALAFAPRVARAAGKSFDGEADVIVVGGGGAAFAAAIGRAARTGSPTTTCSEPRAATIPSRTPSR